MVYRFILNETSYHGPGAIKEIISEIKRRHFKKGLIVTDADLVKFGVVDKVSRLLDNTGYQYEIYDKVEANPTIEMVQEGVKAYKNSGADYIIAIGGGSPQDTAKAIGIIIANPEHEDVRSLEGAVETKNPSIPLICIPTTAGTAAEATINYVITDRENNRKFVCVDPHDIPVVAIVDPDMMMSMPASLTAATGMDALTHAIESYITPGAWDLSRTLDYRAIELISQNLRDAYANEPKGKEMMALAQYVTGMAFSNVGLGIVHAMAHPLSAVYNTPHGVACACLLPYGMEFNKDYTGEAYRDIAKAMGVKATDDMGREEVRDVAIKTVRQLSADVNIPQTLKELGVKEEDFRMLAEQAVNDACAPGNPRTFDIDMAMDLYRTAYNG